MKAACEARPCAGRLATVALHENCVKGPRGAVSMRRDDHLLGADAEQAVEADALPDDGAPPEGESPLEGEPPPDAGARRDTGAQRRPELPADGRVRADRVPWLIALAVFAAYLPISLFRYLRLDPTSWDLGIFTEYVKQYAGLHAPIVDIRGAGFNLLGDHFHPIVALIAPFFRIFPTPVTLLVAQALLAAVSVVPVSRAAADKLGTGAVRAGPGPDAGGGVVGSAAGLRQGGPGVHARRHRAAHGDRVQAAAGRDVPCDLGPGLVLPGHHRDHPALQPDGSLPVLDRRRHGQPGWRPFLGQRGDQPAGHRVGDQGADARADLAAHGLPSAPVTARARRPAQPRVAFRRDKQLLLGHCLALQRDRDADRLHRRNRRDSPDSRRER